jgi:hypothetical protein
LPSPDRRANEKIVIFADPAAARQAARKAVAGPEVIE